MSYSLVLYQWYKKSSIILEKVFGPVLPIDGRKFRIQRPLAILVALYHIPDLCPDATREFVVKIVHRQPPVVTSLQS
jgi:hypothetical protein